MNQLPPLPVEPEANATDTQKPKRQWWDKMRILVPLSLIFPLIGVPLSWFSKRLSLFGKIAISVISILIYANSSNQSSSEIPNPAAVTTFEGVRKEVQRIAEKKLGGSLVTAEVFETARGQEEGLYNVNIRFNGEDSWSPSMTKKTIAWQMQDVYQGLYEAKLNIRDIYCFASLKLTDQYGQESVMVVYKTSLERAIAEKINWDRKRSLDFDNIWDVDFVHRSFDQ